MTHLREIEKALFDAARGVEDPAVRTALLDQACAGNSKLRARIESLLTVQLEAEEFFTVHEPVPDAEPRTRSVSSATQPGSAAAASDPPPLEGPSTRIGRYRLLQRMGEGGCGVVYLAEQEEPMRRQVALKIIRLGMDTESVIARFAVERQTLALMDHPNIAQVLDAGATASGRPYFVMELVRGIKITDFCDQHQMNLAQRLNLFIQVCHAIQHAHQKGVVHRDIKPSNILVAMQDGVPVPKVIDFGIAKLTGGRLADTTVFTSYGQFIGTPSYMSPEQAEINRVDVDTRTDIYSLGVLLYEMLTGRTPFDNKQLMESGWDQMRQTLKEREPMRPSAMLATLPPAEFAGIARQRGIEPARMIAILKGDMDWIVMKALEKDPSRRYETANGLAMDTGRFLENEPVVARPPSQWYRLQKLVRRNKVVFASGAAVSLALVLGLGASTWLFIREREARQEAERGRQGEALLRHQAEARAAIAQAAALVGENQIEAADQVLAGVKFPESGFEGEAVFRPLGEWAAVRGQWSRAAQYLQILVRVDQMETWDVATLDCTRCAAALIEAGDVDGYERFRQEIIKRFTATHDPVVAERTVKNSLLFPADPTIYTALATLADTSAKAAPVGPLTPQEEPWPGATAWRCASLALYHYRGGNFAAASDWSQRCLSYGLDNPARSATGNAILAMASCRIGQIENARSALAISRNLIDTNAREGVGLGNGAQGYWFDWTVARILMSEASQLLALPTAHPAPASPGGLK